MKKLFTFFALALVAVGAFAKEGDEFTLDGVHYYVDQDDSYGRLLSVMPDNALYSSQTSITIPETVTYSNKTYYVSCIREGAFENCSNLTAIELPANGLQSIGYRAFKNCSNIKSIRISDFYDSSYGTYSIDIKNNAIEGCTSLETIEWNTDCGGSNLWNSLLNPTGIKAQIKHVIFGPKVKKINDGKSCNQSYFPNLESVVIGENVTLIDSYVFSNLSKLTQVTLPEKLETINSSAFGGCTALTSIRIPTKVKSIEESAFNGCSALATVIWDAEEYGDGNSPFYCLRENENCVHTVKIGSHVKVVTTNIFHASSYLATIDFSEATSLTEIQTEAFDQCNGITSVAISEGVTTIGSRAFYHCEKLATVSLPSTLKSLGDGVFEDCQKLTTINLPSGLTTIGQSVFEDCRLLNAISIPSTVNSIGQKAFKNCSALPSIEFPEGITTIGVECCYNCTSLTDVKLPATLLTIGQNAFYMSNNITTITSKATNPPSWSGEAFGSLVRDNAKLYVPKNSLETYQQTNPWNLFKSIEKIVAHVSFDLNGQAGTAPETQNVDLGGFATEPDDPESAGYKFLGWYTTKEGTGSAFDFDNTAVNADMTLYAKWQNVAFTLTEGDNTANLATFDGVESIVTVNRGFVADGGWYTLCLPFDMDAELISEKFGTCRIAKLTEVRDKGEGNYYFNFDDVTEIEAGVPYMFKPETTIAANWVVNNVMVSKDLKPVEFTNATMSGVYDNEELPSGAYYLGNNDYLYAYKSGVTTKSLRAYFQFNTVSPVSARAIFSGRQIATDVEELAENAAPKKVLQNGQIFIQNAGKVYTIFGQQVR